MNEQHNNNEKKTEKNLVTPVKNKAKKQTLWDKIKSMNKEKRFYLGTAVSCAVAFLTIFIIVLAVTNSGGATQQAGKDKGHNSVITESTDDTSTDGNSGSSGGSSAGGNKPVVNTPEGMIMPLETVTMGSDYGFYYNQTLNSYYEHAGVDFMAAAGTEVFAVEDGTIESIYKDDLLLGTEIVINHGNGLKTLYRFVQETENVKVGDKVKKGDVIATVAEANGNEYKDGAHLHFEVVKNNETVDPTTYLTLEEK